MVVNKSVVMLSKFRINTRFVSSNFETVVPCKVYDMMI